MLIYFMGNEADDISLFDLTQDDRKKYSPVKDKLDYHFVK